MSPPQTMLTLPLGADRDVTRAVVCARAVVCDEGLVVALGKVEPAELELEAVPLPAELLLPARPLFAGPSLPAVLPLPTALAPPASSDRAADFAAAVFVSPLCIGIAAAAATAAAAAAIKTTINQTVLTLIPPRQSMSRRLSRRVSPVWTRIVCECFLCGSPIMATMLTQVALRAKVRPVSSSVSGGQTAKTVCS